MQSLSIKIFNSPEEAPKYFRPEHKFIKIKEAVIVRNGTVGGNATVDLIVEDEDGQKYIGMLTGRLLKQVTDIL